MTPHYISHARWPKTITVGNIQGENVSTDIHQTEEQAKAVCNMLHLDGFGGDGKVYPLETWITKSE